MTMPALTAQEIITELFRLGHFHNPSHPTSIQETDLSKLTLASAEVRQAVRSYQSFNRSALESIYAAEKGHINVLVDGEIGPLTAKLFSMERCGCPDYSIEGANAEPATGNGSWVHSCDPSRPGVHTIKVWVNKVGMPSFLTPVFESAWELVVSAYQNIGVDFVRVDNKAGANIDFGWPLPPGNNANTIGLAVLPSQPMQCFEQLWARFSATYRPTDLLNQWARLIAHELGHNLRLVHSTGGIMNSYITSGPFTRTAWRGDPSEGILVRYFGGVPLGSPPTPPPPDVDEVFDPEQATFIYANKMYSLNPRLTS